MTPSAADASMIKMLLSFFGNATGLHTNTLKSAAMPIRCGNLDLSHILQPLGIPVKQFPCTYLGMPLSLHALRKVDLEPWLAKFGDKTANWKGSMMAKSGRLVLLKSTLLSLAVYLMTVHKLPTWIRKRVVQLCRAWLWSGEAECNGGKCRVSWQLLTRPKHFGGLGVFDLENFGRALRLRWLWMSWQQPPRPWVGLDLPCDKQDRALFSMATTITVSDGRLARFWHDRWLQGQCPKVIAPSLYEIAIRKNRSVRDSMHNEGWLKDLAHGLTDGMVDELTRLASLLDSVQLTGNAPDQIVWRFTADQTYTARSAYRIQFLGSVPPEATNLLWAGWAPGNCRFFLWTATLGRIPTADLLQRRGWDNNYFCPLCERSLEAAYHLLVECP